MKYVLIRTDDTVEIVDIETNDFLSKCYELINCNFIEIATPNCGRSQFRIVLDDMGKLNDQHFNKLATVFYASNDMLFGNVIVGTAGLNEYGEYDFIGLDEEEAIRLKDYLDFIKTLIDSGVNVVCI